MGQSILKKNECIVLLFLLLSLTSCLPRHTSLAYKNMNSFADKMYIEKEIKMWGIGGGFLNDVNRLNLDFSSNKELDLNEARTFYMDVSEEFLFQVNNDTKIRPYLHQYPFSIDNITLMIIFNKNGDRVHPPYIANVCNGFSDKDNQTYISYGIYENESYTTYHVETYEEAKRIVQNQITSY